MNARRGALLAAMLAVLSVPTTPSARVGDGADIEHGRQVHGRCLACHALAQDRVGPRHCGLLGRRAGSVAGFDYSPAMMAAGIVWSEETLDRFLADPLVMVPGSTMTYAGIPDGRDRADLIAYLRQVDRTPQCRGVPVRGEAGAAR